MDPISATLGLAPEVLPAVSAPSILGGGMTGAGMMTAGAPVVPGILASSTPSIMGGLGALGSAGLQYAKDNPFQTANLGLGIYDRMNAQQPMPQASQLGVIKPQQSGQFQSPVQARIPQSSYPRRLY